jgi:hypothetical protein
MKKIQPRFVVCILGMWKNFREVEATVGQVGGAGFQIDREFSQLESDDRMVDAFEFSADRVTPSMTEADLEAIENHSAVAYILSPPLPANLATELASRALSLIAALLQSGGVAAKVESSGIAHGRERWLALAAENACDAKQSGAVRGKSLVEAFVRRPIGDEDDEVYYSCGMHLLGHRDIEVESSIKVSTAIRCIDVLALQQLSDGGEATLRDGGAFRLKPTDRPWQLEYGPCERYEEDDFLFNPYGYIRIVDE